MIEVKSIYDSIVGKKDVFQKLSELVSGAENFNSKSSDHDVICEYLHVSGDCKEILVLIQDLSLADNANAVVVLKVLCNILIRIASDLQLYSTVGTTIADEILAEGLKTIFSFMKPQQSASRTKIAIHLLSSMVALGKQVASNVFVKLNLSCTLHGHLFHKNNLGAEEDVRTAFLNLIVLFITICGNFIVRQLVDIKAFLNGVFPGLVSDKPSTIILILSTFRTHIIENSVISKSSKVRLFNDYSLQPVLKLLLWKGPLKTVKPRKRKLGVDSDTQVMDVSEDEIKTVKYSAYEFMMSLCTCHKNGIIFRDITFGTSERNNNFVITKILQKFPKPYADVLVSDFVVNVLKTCPEQMRYYLPFLKDSFTPRHSAPWMEMIVFFKKITLSQDPAMCLFKCGDNKPLPKLVKIAKTLIIPNVITDAEISENFKTGHPVVCYYLLDYISCILKQVNEVVNFCNENKFSNNDYSSSELEAFCSSFISCVLQRFAKVSHLQNCWNKVIESVQEENKVEQTNGFPVPSFKDQLMKFIEVVQAFQHITPSFCQDFNIDLAEMCKQLRKCAHFLNPEDTSSINVKIIDLISGNADQSISLWKKGTAKSPLLLTLDIYLTTGDDLSISGISHIIYKILLKSKIFRFCLWEIDVWLHALESTRQSNLSLIVEVFSDALLMIIQEPSKFSNVGHTDAAFQELNASQNLRDDNIYSKIQDNVPEKQYFSSMVSAVLIFLSTVGDDKAKAFRTFTESALMPIMHHQHHFDEMFILIERYKEFLSSKFYNYCQLLYLLKTTREVGELNTEDFSLRKKSNLSNQLQYYFSTLHTCKDEECVTKVLNDLRCFNIDSSIDSFERQTVAWQLLLYIDIETALSLEKKFEIPSILEYQKILQQLITSDLSKAKELVISDYISYVNEEMAFNKLCIVKDFLQHPMILKLFFVSTDHVPKKFRTLFQGYVCSITEVVLNITNVLLCDLKFSYCKKYFIPFKEKLVSSLLNSVNLDLEEKQIFSENQLSQLVVLFSSVFITQDIISILECILENNDYLQKFDQQFSATSNLLKLYIEQKEFILLSRKAIQSLFSEYINMKTKKRKAFRELIFQLLQRHPIYGLFVNSESALSLIHSDLRMLDLLISSNDEIKQTVQLTIVNEINNLKEEGPEFIFLVSRCFSGNLSDVEIEGVLKPIASTFWKVLTNTLLHEISSDSQLLSDSNVSDLVELLFAKKILSENKMKKFFNKVSTIIPSIRKMSILLQLMKIWKQISTESSYHVIFKISLHWLVAVITDTSSTENFQHHELLKFFTETLQNSNSICVEELLVCHQQWIDNFRNILRVGLRDELIGPDLLCILQIYCEKMNMHVEIPTQNIYDLITTHSNFFNILLSENKESISLKEHVIDLLTTIVNINSNVCSKNHIPIFLGAYGAKLSTVDQKLLCLIKLYEDNGIDMTDFSPFLWGKAAVIHYSVNNKNNHNLFRQPKSSDVLNLFQRDSVRITVLNLPLQMELKPSVENWDKEYRYDSVQWDQVYDLRFVLPLLANLISPGSYLHCRSFFISRVLALIFASLSSYQPDIRSVGYYCLTQFYCQLEGAKFLEKDIWLTLLDSLRNSITSPNSRIPCIIAIFLAKLVDIIEKSDHPMYTVLTKFVMVKPNLDIGQFPDFYKLFYSIEIEHRMQKMWILNLLADGTRSSLDFHICQKRHIFRNILSHYYSSLSSQQEKIKILQIILAVVKITSFTARTLCQSGLISWLHNVIFHINSENIDILKNIINIMYVLWKTYQEDNAPEVRQIEAQNLNKDAEQIVTQNLDEDAEQIGAQNLDKDAEQIETQNLNKDAEQLDKNSNDVKRVMTHPSFPYEFFLIQLRLSQKINYIDNETITKYLQTFLDILKFMKNSTSSASSPSYSKLSFQTVSQLYAMCTGVDKQVGNSTQSNLVNKNEEECNVNLIFTQIILFWEPLWNDTNMVCYEKQLTLFTRVVKLMLQITLNSQCYSKDIAKWLYRCLNEDKRMGLLIMFSSVKNIECFELVCQHFENSFLCSKKSNASNVNNVKCKEQSSKWKKLLKCFMKTGENISLIDANPQFYKILNELCE